MSDTPKKTSEWDYDEFCDWAFQKAFDALVLEGTKGLRSEIKYGIVPAMVQLMKDGGFKSRTKQS